ncbi:MAG: heavy-metal-associated domain-containing protein [Mycobacterium sp.]
MSITRTYHVRGMTCGHCVNAVTEELTALDGVSGVSIDLVAQGDSPVTVTGTAEVPLGEIRDAVQRAGYELV